MKILFSTLAVLVIAVVLAYTARQDAGYVLIEFHDWTVEASLAFLLMSVAGVFVVFYLVLRSLGYAHRLPARIGGWRRNRRERRAAAALTRGFVALAQGRWSQAEKALTRYGATGAAGAVNYLYAARAAQGLGASERRDRYLRQAYQSMPGAEVAIALTQAELQAQQGQLEEALAILTRLRELDPKNAAVVRLLLRLYVQVHDWERLIELLPAARKLRVIDAAELTRLEAGALLELLRQAVRRADLGAAQGVWQRMPQEYRRQAPLVAEYVKGLINAGREDEAEGVLYAAIDREWSDALIYLYGTFEGADVGIQRGRAESWLKAHENSWQLLLTLGRLYRRSSLWGQARQHLEACAALCDLPEVYQELAAVTEQLGDNDKALEYYRRGVASMDERQANLRLPGGDPETVPLLSSL